MSAANCGNNDQFNFGITRSGIGTTSGVVTVQIRRVGNITVLASATVSAFCTIDPQEPGGGGP